MKIESLLRSYKVPFIAEGDHHCRTGWIQLHCPDCPNKGADKWHLGYSLAGGYMNCWKCGPKRTLNVLQQLTNERWDVLKKLLGDVDSEVPKTKPKGTLKLPDGVGKLLPAHKFYLRNVRGFDVSNLKRLWGIKGIGIAPKLAWRVFIPITLRGQTVSWTTRSINDKGLRYWSAGEQEESIPHKTLLYGEDYARHSIIIVEGPLDVWAIGPGAVATCGTGFSREQIKRMIAYPIRVVCFDKDATAQQRAERLCDQLMAFPGDTYNVTLTGKDAASSPKTEVRKLRKRFLAV